MKKKKALKQKNTETTEDYLFRLYCNGFIKSNPKIDHHAPKSELLIYY